MEISWRAHVALLRSGCFPCGTVFRACPPAPPPMNYKRRAKWGSCLKGFKFWRAPAGRRRPPLSFFFQSPRVVNSFLSETGRYHFNFCAKLKAGRNISPENQRRERGMLAAISPYLLPSLSFSGNSLSFLLQRFIPHFHNIRGYHAKRSKWK